MVRLTLVRLALIACASVLMGGALLPSAAQAQFISPPTTAEVADIHVADDSLPTPVADIAAGDSMFSFSGTRPDNLGVKDGRLASCPNTPNCVNSQSPQNDAEHYIEPLSYSGSPDEAIATLKSVIEDMDRTEIIKADERYLYSEFTSKIMGFVDDVEFYLDENAGVIHVRSASRLGQSDLGVNRKRIEDIRAKLAARA